MIIGIVIGILIGVVLVLILNGRSTEKGRLTGSLSLTMITFKYTYLFRLLSRLSSFSDFLLQVTYWLSVSTFLPVPLPGYGRGASLCSFGRGEQVLDGLVER